jgi:hypothetical protein
MNRRHFAKLSALSIAAAALPAHAQAPQSGVMTAVLKRSYDLANTGCNLNETTLTLAKVKATGVRLLGTLQMAGDKVGAEAQILIVPSVLMADGFKHDIAVLPDMAGNIWCWDANSFALIWMEHIANPVAGTKAIDAWLINQNWCFLSTPVVDPATNILYGVGWQSPDGTAARGMHYLHAINLKDGSRAQPAIDLASITYQPPSGPLQRYNATLRKQRSSLTLATIAGKKTVIWCAGTVAETSSLASGWVFAYDIASGKITARTLSDANYGAGVWMAGASVSIDSKGFIYLVTGNGTFDGVGSFGECAVKLGYTPPTATAAGAVTVEDWWCGYTDQQREGQSIPDETKIAGVSGPSMAMATGAAVNDTGYNDQDLGSAGGCLIESLGLYLVCGKDGICWPVSISNMGKTTLAQLAAGQQYAQLAFLPVYFTYFPGWGVSPDPLNPAALDVMGGGKTRHNHSQILQYPSATNGEMVFCAGENSPVRAWSITATGITFLAESNEIASAQVTAPGGGMPGMQMTLATCSTGGAILICSAPYLNANQVVSAGRMLIYDAENFANGAMQLIWDSQAEGIPYLYNKFCSLAVSGGRIWLPTYGDQTLVLG